MREDQKLSAEYALKAISLDPLDAENYISLAWVHMLDKRWDRAREAFDRAFELNPNDANSMMSNALATACLGDHEAAMQLSAEATRINPLRPDYYHGYDAIIYFLAGKYDECAAVCRSMAEISPIDLGVWYAAACHYLGEPEEAKRAADNFLAQVSEVWAGDRESSPANIMQWVFEITALRDESDMQNLYQGIQAAGLPCVTLKSA